MLHYSRIAALMLGVWAGGSLLLLVLAANGLDRAATLQTNGPAPFLQALQSVPPASQRAIVRYVVVDQNHYYFDVWEDAQFFIGFVLIVTLFLGVDSRLMSALTFGMVLVVAFEHIKITPELAYLSRSLEFIPLAGESPARDQFWRLHTLYLILDALKLGLAALVSLLLITSKRKRRPRNNDDELFEKRLARAR